LKDLAKMTLTDWEQPIQALSTNGANHAFAMSVGSRRPRRRFQHRQTSTRQHLIDALREDAVAIVNQKAVRLITCGDHPKLLLRPFGRGVRRHIPMHDAARAYIQHDEAVEQPKSHGDGDEEVTGEHGRRVAITATGPARA
jgi:hypothetical protein